MTIMAVRRQWHILASSADSSRVFCQLCHAWTVSGSALEGHTHSVYRVDAAAEVSTGAMIALVPSREDAQRLSMSGGERAGQLHLTLRYLGKASDIPPGVRDEVLTRMREQVRAVDVLSTVAFAASVFNPRDAEKDTAQVLLVQGTPELVDLYMRVCTVLEESRGQFPESYKPWTPHVTLLYSENLSRVKELAERTGPVTFDRLRLAFSGETTDIPLGSPVLAHLPGKHNQMDHNPYGAPKADFAQIGKLSLEKGQTVAWGTSVSGLSYKVVHDGDGKFDVYVKSLTNSDFKISKKDVGDPAAVYNVDWKADESLVNKETGKLKSNAGEKSLPNNNTGSPIPTSPTVEPGGNSGKAFEPSEEQKNAVDSAFFAVPSGVTPVASYTLPHNVAAKALKVSKETGMPLGHVLQTADVLFLSDPKAPNSFTSKVNGWLQTAGGKSWLTKNGVTPGGKIVSTPPASTAKNYGVSSGMTLTPSTSFPVVSSITNAPPPLTASQKASLQYYTGTNYIKINKVLRAGTVSSTSPSTQEHIKQIKKGMRPLSKPVTVFRNASFTALGVNDGSQLNGMVGKTISDKGFVSTSVRSSIGIGSPQVRMEIHAPAGTMGHYVAGFSKYPTEKELLLDSGTQFKIKEVKQDAGGKSVVVLEVVGPVAPVEPKAENKVVPEVPKTMPTSNGPVTTPAKTVPVKTIPEASSAVHKSLVDKFPNGLPTSHPAVYGAQVLGIANKNKTPVGHVLANLDAINNITPGDSGSKSKEFYDWLQTEKGANWAKHVNIPTTPPASPSTPSKPAVGPKPASLDELKGVNLSSYDVGETVALGKNSTGWKVKVTKAPNGGILVQKQAPWGTEWTTGQTSTNFNSDLKPYVMEHHPSKKDGGGVTSKPTTSLYDSTATATGASEVVDVNFEQVDHIENAPPPLLSSSLNSLKHWTAHFGAINKYLRGFEPGYDGAPQHVKNMLKAMRPLQKAIKARRLSGFEQFGVKNGLELKALIGKTVTDKGFVSTTIAPDLSHLEHHDIFKTAKLEVVFEMPKGTMGYYVEPFSQYKGQKEFLVQAGAKYKIKSVTPPSKPGGRVVAVVEVVV
jgi:2'-5' RNA ligase